MKFTRDALLNAPDRVFDSFPTSLGEVTIQSLTETERSTLDAKNLDDHGMFCRKRAVGSRARMVVASVVDPNTSEPIFQPGDVKVLAAKCSSWVATVYAKCLELNGIEDYEEGEADTVKNSEETGGSSLPVESPAVAVVTP